MQKELLIVDDEPRITNSFKVLFENRGFSIQTASNGYDAIEIFKKHTFSVVLSDIQMDGMDGVEMMHTLHQIDPCVQIVFLTGHASINNATKVLKHNSAFEYLEKPVKKMDDLYQIIQDAEHKYDREKRLTIKKEQNQKEFDICTGVFDSMETMIYVADTQTFELIYTNKKLTKALGYNDWREIKDRKCWQVIHQGQTGPCAFCTNKRILNGHGDPGKPYEWEFHSPLNHRWYNIIDKAVKWYDDRVVKLGTALDITEKKEQDRLFRKFEKAIETSKKLESLGTLAGGIAHDFNNTLSSIVGNINLAQLSCPDNEIQKYLHAAEQGVMQAKKISSELIGFASGYHSIKIKIDVERLIKQSVEKHLDQKKITCSFENESIPDSFYADLNQLRLVIKNIFKNSEEAMGGRGQINIAVKYLRYSMRDPKIAISICDSGCGISKHNLDMIFNPYFTTKPLGSMKSTGLGLSHAWAIITRHGGEIFAESTVNKGTTIHIHLPIANEKSIDLNQKLHTI